MFNFLKKEKGVPDVGKEEEFDLENGNSNKSEKQEDKLEKIGDSEDSSNEEIKQIKSAVSGADNIQLERLNAKIDSIVAWINQFYERFSYVSENIGELRQMGLANEKKISESMKEAEKVIDIVKEVKPEKLRIEYQRADIRIKTIEEKISATKDYMDTLLEEIKDIRRKSEVFVGTENLMKLNADTKKDIIELQKLGAKTKLNADKSQEIFLETRKNFEDSQKVLENMNNLSESFSGLKKEIEKLKLNYEKVVDYDDYADFKKSFGNKLAIFEDAFSEVQVLKQENEKLNNLIETSLNISRRNQEDIGDIGLKIGDRNVKRVSDYENQMDETLKIIEELASQVAEVRKKLKMKESKIIKLVKKQAEAAEKNLKRDIKKINSSNKAQEIREKKDVEKNFLGKLKKGLSEVIGIEKTEENNSENLVGKKPEEENEDIEANNPASENQGNEYEEMQEMGLKNEEKQEKAGKILTEKTAGEKNPLDFQENISEDNQQMLENISDKREDAKNKKIPHKKGRIKKNKKKIKHKKKKQ